MAPPASVDEFKARFDRDFVWGTSRETIRDLDISNAFVDALLLFNSSLWSTDEVKTAFLYLAAHCLFLNISAAGGLSDRQGNGGLDGPPSIGILQSKSVGQVSASYALPERIINDPILSQFARSSYGQRYLAMIEPRLVGSVLVFPNFREDDVG